MGFSRQEYWSGLSCPSPENLCNTGIECRSPTLWADSLQSETPGKPIKKEKCNHINFKLSNQKIVQRNKKTIYTLGEKSIHTANKKTDTILKDSNSLRKMRKKNDHLLHRRNTNG